MKRNNLHPYLIIILSFLGIIVAGTIALIMPFTLKSGHTMGFTKALFMSASAVCVTGLSVFDLAAEFTVYGKVIMALLIEIGGLSIITIAVFFFTMGGKIGVTGRFLLRESLNQNTASGLVPLVRKIVAISLSVQVVCAGINMIEFVKYYPTIGQALAASAFHSISAFNNAGFDIFGNNSLIGYRSNVLINCTTMFMIIVGSMGFIVLDDVFKNKFIFKKFSLHTKITLLITFCLIVAGGLLIKLTVRDVQFTWLQAFFQSVTCRTAGFATYDLALLKQYPAAYFIFITLMFIGASPCSTGGGVKTTTFAVVILAIFHFGLGKRTKLFKRNLPKSQIFKAFVLITIAVMIIVSGTFIVSLIQPGMTHPDGALIGIDEILFEVTSAFTTTGLSMGITCSLNGFNRVLLCIIMFCGRLGPLTIIGVLNKNWMGNSNEQIKYLEENVIIG